MNSKRTHLLRKEIQSGIKCFQVIALWSLLMIPVGLMAQGSRFPATLNTNLNPPYTLFLDELTEPGSNAFSASIVFNDFAEDSWNFRLRISIESQDVRIQTSPAFIPVEPITLLPGEPFVFRDLDWVEYLDYRNLTIEGLGVEEIRQSGRLPEGFYTFCIEVLDYDTGEPLSTVSCQSAFIKLLDPPRPVTPLCGTYVDPKLVQFNFIWQLFNSETVNSVLGTTYQLTIWELLDESADPLSAVNNGQALQVYQSPILGNASLNYGPAEPALENGKRYIYQTQAFDPDGKDRFKNNGKSEFCNFYYGWPTGGNVALIFPLEDGGFRRDDNPYVKFKTVDNILPNEQVSYHIKVAPLEDGQSREEALDANTPFYTHETTPTSSTYEPQFGFYKELAKDQEYVWEVKAVADGLEVGDSDIALFHGPPLVETFYAGLHIVQVDYLNNSNLDDLSGGGRIRLAGLKGPWTEITFSHIDLDIVGLNYLMKGGEFFHDPVDDILTFQPQLPENETANFTIVRYRVNSNGISVFGHVSWALPHVVAAVEKPMVVTADSWANYNNFSVNHAFKLNDQNNFRLLDPYNHELNLNASSTLYVNNNQFWLDFNGDFVLPKSVSGEIESKPVAYTFDKADQLFYLSVKDGASANDIVLAEKVDSYLEASDYTIDLSEEKSPGQLSDDLTWKGVYFDRYNIRLGAGLDHEGQLSLGQAITFEIQQDKVVGNKAWEDATGLNLALDQDLDEKPSMTFQTFTSRFKNFSIYINENLVADSSSLVGDLRIPFVSTTDYFDFQCQITNSGIEEGYLINLEGTKFSHNPDGGPQRIDLEITRAVLLANEKIAMNLNIDWTDLEVSLKNVRGFTAWGDNYVGFGEKNGTVPLENRTQAKVDGYPITISVIGAGSSDGRYLMATKTDVALGDDVSGNGKAPEANIYSLVTNEFAPAGDLDFNTDPVTEDPLEEKIAGIKEKNAADEEKLKEEIAKLPDLADESSDVISGFSSTVVEGIDYRAAAEAAAEESSSEETTEEGGGDDDKDQLIKGIAEGFVDEFIRLALGKYTKKIDSINLVFNGKIDSLQQKAVDWAADKPIKESVDFVVEGIAKGFRNDESDVLLALRKIGDVSKAKLKNEFRQALGRSVQKNIKGPVTQLIQQSIKGRILDHIAGKSTEAILQILGDGTINGKPGKELITELPQVFQEILNDAGGILSPDSLYQSILWLGKDFVSNIDTKSLGDELKKEAAIIAAELLAKKGAEALAGALAGVGDDFNLGVFGGGGANPINFAGIGNRLFSGASFKEALFMDPVMVNLKTPVLELNGPIQYTPEHPEFGDVWTGDIKMTIKVPKPIEFKTIYINGRKDDLSYWFCQIDALEEDPPGDEPRKAYTVGKPISKEAKKLKEPANLGGVDLVAASGRLYHHMSEQDNGYILPDASMNYGAFMHLVLFDGKSEGQNMRLEVSCEVNSATNGDFTLAFEGNMQSQSTVVEVKRPDPNAVVHGEVLISYNSAEKHFLGYARVVLNKPNTLCAEGSLLVDVKPGIWRVAIGSREERIVFVPGCAGWSPTGWLDINQQEAELGLGVQLSARMKTPILPGPPPFLFRITADVGLAFGVLAAIQYRPEFKLLRAGVWAEAWVYIDLEYKKYVGKWKSRQLLDIFISGDLTLHFDKDPNLLEGKVHGRARILGIGASFKGRIEKEI